MIDIFKKINKLQLVRVVYWLFLAYMVAAFIWWYVTLVNQNEQIANVQYGVMQTGDPNLVQKVHAIEDFQLRKNKQYLGEGITILFLFLCGAIYVYRSLIKQIRYTNQQQNFMMAVTHELKTPIAITKLNLETLQKRKLEETQHEKLINNTLQEANRMNSLCNNLLLSSQMEAGGYQYANEKTDLSELTENCIKEFSSRYSQLKIIKEIDNDILVIGDYFLLQMAINNLIDNAIKYSPKDTALAVRLNKNSAGCELCIIDEGSGIQDADKKKIFEKYYRTGSEATQKSKGTGLGLFLVKKIIDTHKGNIKVEDNFPKGTKFTIGLKTIA